MYDNGGEQDRWIIYMLRSQTDQRTRYLTFIKFVTTQRIPHIPQQRSFHKLWIYTVELSLWKGLHILKVESIVLCSNLYFFIVSPNSISRITNNILIPNLFEEYIPIYFEYEEATLNEKGRKNFL